MDLKSVFSRLAIIFILGLIFSLAAPSRADSYLWTEKKPSPLETLETPASSQEQPPIFIYLATDAFDPLRSIPDIPPALAYSESEAAVSGTYILQFTGPVKETWKSDLRELGVIIGDYIPEHSFLVHLEPDSIDRIEVLPYVRWIGPYQPAYKLSPHVDFSGRRSYRIILGNWADEQILVRKLASIDVNSAITAGHASAVLDGEALMLVANMPGVVWIEPYYLNQLHNDIAGGSILGGSAAWSNDFTGMGNTIAVTDSGLDTGNPSSIHQDFTGRVAHISSWPVQGINWGSNCFPNNVGANDGAADLDSGHGSHVTGSLAGSGAASSGQFKGLAYQASITFQAIEQHTDWPDSCPLNDGYYVTGIPADLRLLLDQVYGWGARIQNYSWGGGSSGLYDTQASYVDDFIFNHQDMTLLVSAGNSGVDDNQDGYVDADSIKSPGVAKNLITIGASDNERTSGGYSAYTWFQLSGGDFSVNPTRNDYTSDEWYEMAAFSSRGLTDDGRIKPDLVAPGTNIVSVRSSQAGGIGWGVYNAYYMYNGGTSMASPLAAGAATLVRDYYRSAEGHMNPSGALIKATLINTAVDIDGYGNSSFEAGQPIPNAHEGWGLIDVGAATSPGNRQFVDETAGLGTGGADAYYFNLFDSNPFKVTLVWSDYPGSPGAGKALVNDLNLRLTAPDGTTVYWGNQFLDGWSRSGGLPDSVNNVENVYLQIPATGIWKVEVVGQNVPMGPQPYALVIDGDFGLKAPLALNSITPTNAFNNAPLTDALISGTGFEPGTTVQLKQGTQTIPGTNVVVDVTHDRITADFNINGAPAGWWDVVVSNAAETDTLIDGLFIKDASLPDLVIEKRPLDNKIDPGSFLTYTISIENSGFVTSTGVTFTDTLPGGVSFVDLTPDCDDGVVSLPGGFACTVQPMTLTAGTSVEYTLVVSVSEDSNGILINQVEVIGQELDAYLLNNQSTAEVLSGMIFYYLPHAMKNYPRTPSAPTLLPIENSDLDGSYNISWQAGSGPQPNTYDLQENGSLLLTGYSGTTYSAAGKPNGAYIYRVRGNNANGSGPWSDPQSVTVGSPTNTILNGGFENGRDGSWTEESSNNFDLIMQDFSPTTITPHSGQWGVWMGGWDDEQSTLSQLISIPSGKSLSFWYWSASLETNCENDLAYVMIDQQIIQEIKLCQDYETNGWTKQNLDLSSFTGSSALLMFLVQTNGSLNSNLFLDDINLE